MANLLHNEIFKYLNQVIRLALNYKYNQLEAKQKKKTKKKWAVVKQWKWPIYISFTNSFNMAKNKEKTKFQREKKMIRD